MEKLALVLTASCVFAVAQPITQFFVCARELTADTVAVSHSKENICMPSDYFASNTAKVTECGS